MKKLYSETDEKCLKQNFHIKDLYFYTEVGFSFLDSKGDSSALPFSVRTIDPKSSVITELLKTGNVVRPFSMTQEQKEDKSTFRKKEFYGTVTSGGDTILNPLRIYPMGLIVTKRLLQVLNLDTLKTSYISLNISPGIWVPVQVLAVVRELPDLSDVVCTYLFYCKKLERSTFDLDNKYLRIMIENLDKKTADQVQNFIVKKLNLNNSPMYYKINTPNKYGTAWIFEIGNEGKKISDRSNVISIRSIPLLQKYHLVRYIRIFNDTVCETDKLSHTGLAVEFSKLDKIRAFSDFINKLYSVTIPMELLEDRENYLFSGNLSLGLIIMVLILSLFSITIFISSTFINHIARIKKNLGNFLAFGIRNNKLLWIYLILALLIMIISIIPAFFFSLGTGKLIEKVFLEKLLVLQTDHSTFSLVNSWFFVLVGFIIIATMVSIYFSIFHTLKNSPGDLVYERDYKMKRKKKKLVKKTT
ncbi:MAG: hypothetical protein NTX61_07205 [Bacteroidetes bacterium]|nr:hypothetical protein [Bacteroidota bacterium]